MLDFVDFGPEAKKKREEEKTRLNEQRKLRQQVSVVMSEVKGDPRWKVYADHVLYQKELNEKRANGAKDRLADAMTFLSAEEYGKLKLEAAYNRGRADGLQAALDTIKDLIDRGKEPERPPEEKSA